MNSTSIRSLSGASRSSVVAAIAIPLIFGVAASAVGAELPTKPLITLDMARRVIAAAETEAKHKNWPGVIAVVDAGGYPIALERMDASPMLASTELAPAKARTAALFGKPTAALEEAIHNGRLAAATAGFVEMDGGVPLIVNGSVVGAIGVSTAQPDWDIAIARTGAAAFEEAATR